MKRLNRIVVLMLAVFALSITCKSDGGGDPDDEGYTYTVTFNKNGGDTEASPATMTVTSPATNVGTLPTAPVKAGYALVGWNTKADGSGSAFTATTTVTADITVFAQWKGDNDLTITLDMIDNVGGDSVTVLPKYAAAGATVTITYNVAADKTNNHLVFSGITSATIASVTSAGTGTRDYEVAEEDATDGVITIFATFTHSDKEIDEIAFATPGNITKTYGDAAFTNAATTVSESGTITYTSSNISVATVDADTGEVTIEGAGTSIIKATRAEDETYAKVETEYLLTVEKASGATLTGTLTAATNGITTDSIEITAVAQPDNEQTVEYAISTANSEPSSGWQDETSFTGLNASTTYYIFARAKADANYNAGTAISGTFTTATPSTLRTSWDFSTNPSVTVGTVGAANTITTSIGASEFFDDNAIVLTVKKTGTNNATVMFTLPFNIGDDTLGSFTSIVLEVRGVTTGTGNTQDLSNKVFRVEAQQHGTAFSLPSNDSGSNITVGRIAGNASITLRTANAGTWQTLTVPNSGASTLKGEVDLAFWLHNTQGYTYEVKSVTLVKP